ncbi:MAG: hypothetical protein ACYCRD_04690 [Leptospirillum sp.]
MAFKESICVFCPLKPTADPLSGPACENARPPKPIAGSKLSDPVFTPWATPIEDGFTDAEMPAGTVPTFASVAVCAADDTADAEKREPEQFTLALELP